MLKAAADVGITTDILQISDCMYYSMPVYMTLCDCSLETYVYTYEIMLHRHQESVMALYFRSHITDIMFSLPHVLKSCTPHIQYQPSTSNRYVVRRSSYYTQQSYTNIRFQLVLLVLIAIVELFIANLVHAAQLSKTSMQLGKRECV